MTNNIKILGYGSYIPKKVVTNDDLSKRVDTSDEWISKRTGIRERRIATADETTSFMASRSALSALESAGKDAEEVELIIVATSSQDSAFPSTACLVQNKIEAINATCFDLAAACTGFVYALDTAAQFLKTGRFKNALVIGAEMMSKGLDWSDRGTCILFGDGAGAIYIEAGTEENKVFESYTKSDGTKADVLSIGSIPYIDIYENLKSIDRPTIYMNGREVFKFACNVVVDTIQRLADKINIDVAKIDYIVPHQANLRIIEYVAGKLNIDIEKFYTNVDKYGNTSAASIPLALDEMNKNNLLKPGQKILLVGFGGGLTWGGILLEI